MMFDELLEKYFAGPKLLRDAVAGMTAEQIDAKPVPGKWSTRQVVCHIADFEPILMERCLRVLAEENPPMRGANPDAFDANLSIDQRDITAELDFIEAGRKKMRPLLLSLTPEQLERTGVHSERGQITLLQVLTSTANHIPHHVKFIDEKRRALGI